MILVFHEKSAMTKEIVQVSSAFVNAFVHSVGTKTSINGV